MSLAKISVQLVLLSTVFLGCQDTQSALASTNSTCELRVPIRIDENSLKRGIRLHELDFSESIHSEKFMNVAKNKFFLNLFLMENSGSKDILGFTLGCYDCNSENPDFPLIEQPTSFNLETNPEGIVENNTSVGGKTAFHTKESWVISNEAYKTILLRAEVKMIIEDLNMKSIEIKFPVREYIEFNAGGAWVWRPPHSLDFVCFTGATLAKQ